MDIVDLQQANVVRGRHVDASAHRERQRQRRLRRLLLLIGVPLAFFWYRELFGTPLRPGVPDVLANNPEIWMSVGLMALLAGIVLARCSPPVVRPTPCSGRRTPPSASPTSSAPRQTRREAIDTLNLFLAHRTFAEEMGGTPRRGVLFEGAPGTGKTYLAKAMAGEAGVPFLFVSASAFQSMYFGQTNRKIRTYFKALRKAARKRRRGDRVHRGVRRHRRRHGGHGRRAHRARASTAWSTSCSCRCRASTCPRLATSSGQARRRVNLLLPAPSPSAPAREDAGEHAGHRGHQPRRRSRPRAAASGSVRPVDALRSAASHRSCGHRRYYLAKKSHGDDVTPNVVAERPVATRPVRIERLLDEALICRPAPRPPGDDQGRRRWKRSWSPNWGCPSEVGYQPDERRRIAIPRGGSRAVAALVGRGVTVASILRRGGSLGLVAPRRRRGTPPAHAVGGSDLIAGGDGREGCRDAGVRRGLERHRQRSRGCHHIAANWSGSSAPATAC